MKKRSLKFSPPGKSGLTKIVGFIILVGLIGQARIFYLEGKFSMAENETGEEVPVREAAAADKIRVYIYGEVETPGLYSLSPGCRLGDAIEKAGGLSAGACLAEVNPARTLEDGEKIKIGRKKGFFSRIGAGKSPPVRYIVPPEDKKEEIEVIREK